MSQTNDMVGKNERLIKGFFGPGNVIWPDQDLASDAGQKVKPYLDVLAARDASEIPVMLPRRASTGSPLVMYVIARDPQRATIVGSLLTAFVGPSFSYFDGLPAVLDDGDPVERAVREYAADDRLAFKVTLPTGPREKSAWGSLRLLQDTLRQCPHREWRVRRPVGKLIGEFEAALAAGDNSASAALLEEIAAGGGLSGANLANLRIKRLSRLGHDAELLRFPGLTDVAATRPPALVRDAILAAIFRAEIAGLVEEGGPQRARPALFGRGLLVQALLAGGVAALAGLGGEALVVAALTADLLGDTALLAAVLLDPHRHDLVAGVAPAVVEALMPAPPAEETILDALSVPADTGPADDVTEAATPQSWLELVVAISAGTDIRAVVESEDWQQWPPPADDDEAIAEALAGLGDREADRAWLLAGPIVDADGYARPAARTARQLIEIALVGERFGPGDLAAIIALAEIYLRSSPSATDYAGLLDDLASQHRQWAGPDRATVILDLIDLLLRAAPPDESARLRLAMPLLQVLRANDGRLEPDQAQFARELSEELHVTLEWPDRGEKDAGDSLSDIPPTRMLLYSLDEAVLKQARDKLKKNAPHVDVRLNHEKDGSPSLRKQARNVDIVVLVTRCAKHAATGFIRQHASDGCLIVEADGSRAPSVVRAAAKALRARAGT